jgi:hypothetical protein
VRRSEEDESLLDVTFDALDFLADDVESDGLGDWSALANGDDITDLEAESWGAVSGEGLMALLKTIVLFDVMEIVASDDNRASHLGGNNDTPNQAIIINKYTIKEKATNEQPRALTTVPSLCLDLLEDSSSDADVAGEWAFLVNVVSFNCFLWGLEACARNRKLDCARDSASKAHRQWPRQVRVKCCARSATYQVQFFCRI